MKRIFFLISIIGLFFLLGAANADLNSLIAQGDQLYTAYDNNGALKAYLSAMELDSLSYEANWKTSRAFVDVGETIEDDDQRADYYLKGSLHARRATRINPEGGKGHLYLSVALGRVALDAGAKERIRLSKEIKSEVDLAIKYDPSDDIAYHVLGRWNRKLANLSWIEKGFADMFLGGVPEDASDENAVDAFKKAIEIKPKYINHYLELGKTYEMMGLDKEAAEAFQKCLELPKSDSDDDKYKAEAKDLLDSL
ncbi:MAG: tetratricopeptide repeat protein [Calditrichales bacterium]|nr:MAG: tetratricopeptide repeat protein [Calditrichales bacterium]